MNKKIALAASAAMPAATPSTARAADNNANCQFLGWNSTFVWKTGVSALECYEALNGNTDGAADRIRMLGELEVKFDLNGASPAWNGWSEPSPDATWITSNAPLTFSEFVSGRFAIALKQSTQYNVYSP